MNRFAFLKFGCSTVLALSVVVGSSLPTLAQGLDRVRDRNGVSRGKITKMSALGVTLSKGGVETKKPVEEIESITFAGEPDELAPARRDVGAGRFKKALEKLEGIDLAEVERSEIKQEINYLVMLCKVQLALSGNGTLDDARQQAKAFLSENSKCYRVPQAIELLGDVLMASEDYEGARTQYTKLGKAPAPYFKTRSAILIGRSLQAEGEHQEAVSSFEKALQAAEGNTVAESQALGATLDLAVSQAALGEVEQSTGQVKLIIEKADTKDTELLARAYVALGDCYLQAKDPKSARQAFLHVDLLFSSAGAEHAKALYELSRLWGDLGQPDRALDAKERLQKNHPGSPWAKR